MIVSLTCLSFTHALTQAPEHNMKLSWIITEMARNVTLETHKVHMYPQTQIQCGKSFGRIPDKTVIIWTKDTPTSPWTKTTFGPSVSAVSAPANTDAPAAKGESPDVGIVELSGEHLGCELRRWQATLWKESLRGS